MTIIDRPPSTTRTTTTRLRSWQPYLLLIFILLSLFLAYQWWQTTRNWNATQGSLEETLNTLLKAQEDLRAEQESNAPLLDDLDAKDTELENTNQELNDARQDLTTKDTELGRVNRELDDTRKDLATKDTELENTNQDLEEAKQQLATRETELGDARRDLSAKDSELGRVNQELDDTRKDLATKNTELENTRQDLEEAKQQLTTLERELADLRKDQEDLKICEQDALTICSPPLADDLPQLEFTKGQGQIDEKYSSILLLGERENRYFPRRSFYESVGVFTLNSGSWSLSANGIGGREDTGASAISLEWDATPQSCIEQPNGSWEEAFRVDCEVRFEWTVRSRYPYSTLQLIPIESVIPPEEEP